MEPKKCTLEAVNRASVELAEALTELRDALTSASLMLHDCNDALHLQSDPYASNLAAELMAKIRTQKID